MAAVRNGKPAVSRRFSAALRNPPWRRSLLRRHGDSDPVTAILILAGLPARNRMATLKIVMGATAPVAPFPLRRLHSEPASSWEGVSRWAGGRPSGGRPPAQRETQNNHGGLLTA
ncbi:hypothetical protein NDU88_007270 [Pleurodeles waltl]|uniref:Uncharacterized protein n=1 Tax=Pleurodeles waltl TaxID=8319 RepID=A0AAV7VS19_PLEWA|nr:hypothetical protein NDU88_007270 [Pleurodeles waltl]